MYILNKPCGLVHRGMIGSGIENGLQHCGEDLQLMGRGCVHRLTTCTHTFTCMQVLLNIQCLVLIYINNVRCSDGGLDWSLSNSNIEQIPRIKKTAPRP